MPFSLLSEDWQGFLPSEEAGPVCPSLFPLRTALGAHCTQIHFTHASTSCFQAQAAVLKLRTVDPLGLKEA